MKTETIVFKVAHLRNFDPRTMMTILRLQQYYNDILILQQHSIYNVWNGHFKVSAIFQKSFYQLYKYSWNIARFRRNIFEIFPQYYGAMWVANKKYKFQKYFTVKYLVNCLLIYFHYKRYKFLTNITRNPSWPYVVSSAQLFVVHIPLLYSWMVIIFTANLLPRAPTRSSNFPH